MYACTCMHVCICRVGRYVCTEAAEGSSVWGGKVSQIDTHKLDISIFIEHTMSYYNSCLPLGGGGGGERLPPLPPPPLM